MAPILVRIVELREALALVRLHADEVWDYRVSDEWRIVLNGRKTEIDEPSDLGDTGIKPTNCGKPGNLLPHRAAFFRNGKWFLECDIAANGFIEPIFNLARARVVNEMMEKEITRVGGKCTPFEDSQPTVK